MSGAVPTDAELARDRRQIRERYAQLVDLCRRVERDRCGPERAAVREADDNASEAAWGGVAVAVLSAEAAREALCAAREAVLDELAGSAIRG